MDTAAPNPEERFRHLFTQLDQQSVWQALLPSKHLATVRVAAADPASWRVFLAGNPPNPQEAKAKAAPENAPTSSPKTEPKESEDQEEPAQNGVENDSAGKPAALTASADAEPQDVEMQPNGTASPAPSSLPIPAKLKPIPAKSPSRRTPLSSPRSRRDHPFKFGRFDGDDVAILSAIVRRRLAVASVDHQMFYNVPGALPLDDARYEIDVGMLEGDDAGYASFEQLEREEEASKTCHTGPYVLLGCDEDTDGTSSDLLSSDERSSPGLQSKERHIRSTSTLKRPRRTTAAFGLSDKMERFIRELRVLCEPHRDAAQVESAQKRDVPKNIHRKAVSAASVVEELKEMEYKAHIGKYERVEECISAVSACIGNQDKTFAEVLTQIKDRANDLRDEYRIRKERHLALMKVKTLTTGVLGSDVEWLESTDDDDMDEDMPELDAGRQTDEWNASQPAPSIPFAESDLECWPSNDDASILDVSPERPRLPIFESNPDQSTPSDSKKRSDIQKGPDSIISILGTDNHIMKSIFSLHRVRKLREQIAVNWALLNRRRLAMRTSNKSPPLSTVRSSVKMEDVLPNNSSSPGRSKLIPSAAVGGHGGDQIDEDFEIRNDALDVTERDNNASREDSRERAMGRAVVAVMFTHAGFKHASSLAVEVLTDALEDFVERIGQSLVSCRENIDRPYSKVDSEGVASRKPSKEEVFAMLDLVCESGFQGNFYDLEGYVRYDILRNEQGLREAELRLRAQITKLNQEMAKTETRQTGSASSAADAGPANITPEQNKSPASQVFTPRNDVRLDGNAFTFGYLGSGVCLDVLGTIKVPRKLAGDTPRLEDVTMAPVSVSDKENEGSKDPDKAPNFLASGSG
ncbi:unnamed protein product [Chondrus crispus]|uniref:Bromodomain associated domain-containing protein n=1 Tax=Chondrus crispus TaxID=2769 RepID=R7QN36_CHOCR|nr:unnamed protein product [Chondrus crispus]CDF39479.1 unnamed protein product [Chondrus crispus]|eukprot:XP_005719390.1 unnamed protein product [Chondrus crispus]